MSIVVPMKYLKVDQGFIALVWALEGPLNVSKEVLIDIVEGDIVVKMGEVVLPILDEMLPLLFKSPKIQVSFMTSALIDDKHVVVELDLPRLYEVKGALGVLRQQTAQSV